MLAITYTYMHLLSILNIDSQVICLEATYIVRGLTYSVWLGIYREAWHMMSGLLYSDKLGTINIKKGYRPSL